MELLPAHVNYGHGVGPDRDSDLIYFIAVNSQTDHLPIGEVRQHWNPEELREKDIEIAAFETSERE
ncbi:MAG TPA: hypothetical protein VH255_07630, partial [Verrucomicrobiae bacterium]|nr:hypothetical protein [Verrucomicrobiae bacterium]